MRLCLVERVARARAQVELCKCSFTARVTLATAGYVIAWWWWLSEIPWRGIWTRSLVFLNEVTGVRVAVDTTDVLNTFGERYLKLSVIWGHDSMYPAKLNES